MDDSRTILITARGIADACETSYAPGALLIQAETLESGGGAWRVLALGRPSDVESHPASAADRRLDLPEHIVTPAFVNAHAHLDLTHMGPMAYDAGNATFADWVNTIRAGRANDTAGVTRSVEAGIRKSIAGGVIAIGDIAGVSRTEPLDALRASPLHGVSFIEHFGLGSAQDASIELIDALLSRTDDSADNVARALHPHAPYSAGRRVFAHIARISRERSLPVCAHLAETLDEREFVRSGGGVIAEFLESLGLYDDMLRADVGQGQHPIEHVASALCETPFLLAHVNDCPIGMERTLAETGATVAYCPRAHGYFGHERTLGEHPYRRLMYAGVPVALATDSIVNIPPEHGDRLTPLDDARTLFGRDALDPRALLAMITTVPARALGLDDSLFTIRPSGLTLALNATTVTGDAPRDPLTALFVSVALPMMLSPEVNPSRTLESLGAGNRYPS